MCQQRGKKNIWRKLECSPAKSKVRLHIFIIEKVIKLQDVVEFTDFKFHGQCLPLFGQSHSVSAQ